MSSGEGPLGRRPPADWIHADRYPLRALPLEARPSGVPVVIGVNWYRAFDAPMLIERMERGRKEWWVRDVHRDLGHVRGGHAVALEPFSGPRDIPAWWKWHDQVSEGICTGEAVARCMALLNRRRYQPRPVYDEAQRIDEWPGESPAYEGTSVRAALDVARTLGMVPARPREPQFLRRGEVNRPFAPSHGIAANRWALDTDEAFAALGDADAEAAVWLNSWGEGYPPRVHVPREVLERLLHEDGEFGIPTDH